MTTRSILDARPSSPERSQGSSTRARIGTHEILDLDVPDPIPSANSLLTPLLIQKLRLQGSDIWHNLFDFMYDLYDDAEGRENRSHWNIEELRFLCKTFAIALPPPDNMYIVLASGFNQSSSQSEWELWEDTLMSGPSADQMRGVAPCRTMRQALSVVRGLRGRGGTTLQTIRSSRLGTSLNTSGYMYKSRSKSGKETRTVVINEIRVTEGTIGEMEWMRDWFADTEFMEYCDSNIMLSEFAVYVQIDNLRIRGAGIGKTIYYGSFCNEPLKQYRHHQNRHHRYTAKDFKGIVISDMTITNPFGSGVLVRESGTMKVERCEITGCNQGALVEGYNHQVHDSVSIEGGAQASLELSNCHIHRNRHSGASTSWHYEHMPKQYYLKLTDCEIDYNGGAGVCCFEAVVDIHGDKSDIHHNRGKGCVSEILNDGQRDEGYPHGGFRGISIHLPMSPCHHNQVHVHLENPMAAEMESEDDEAEETVVKSKSNWQWSQSDQRPKRPKDVKSKPPAGNWTIGEMRWDDKDDYDSEPSDDEEPTPGSSDKGACGIYCHADNEPCGIYCHCREGSSCTINKRDLCGCGQPRWVKKGSYCHGNRNVFTDSFYYRYGNKQRGFEGFDHSLQDAYQNKFGRLSLCNRGFGLKSNNLDPGKQKFGQELYQRAISERETGT